jgi:hypothetical protein
MSLLPYSPMASSCTLGVSKASTAAVEAASPLRQIRKIHEKGQACGHPEGGRGIPSLVEY